MDNLFLRKNRIIRLSIPSNFYEELKYIEFGETIGNILYENYKRITKNLEKKEHNWDGLFISKVKKMIWIQFGNSIFYLKSQYYDKKIKEIDRHLDMMNLKSISEKEYLSNERRLHLALRKERDLIYSLKRLGRLQFLKYRYYVKI